MSTRDERTWIADGIYEDKVRRYATVHVRGAGFREKRFPLSQPIPDIEQWRRDERVRLLEKAKRGTTAGSFGRDADRYVKLFTPHLASAKSIRLEVEQWKKHFKDVARSAITPEAVQKIRLAWLAQGLSAKTINNRINTLARLYRCLDGKRAWTPCNDLEPLHVHRTPIQFVTDDVIAKVDETLQLLERGRVILSPRPRARFRVLVTTGRRPSELMRAQPDDVDMQRRVWLPRDGKGGFSPGIYLNDDMLAAWEFFITVGAWGTYDTNEQAKVLYKAGWPRHIKPYNARHTVGISLSERGVDLDDVGAHMGHKRRETTRKHYVPVLNSRMQKASELLAGRFRAFPQVQTTAEAVQTAVQTARSLTRRNAPKFAENVQTEKPRSAKTKPRVSSMKTKKKR